jgi:hypothetical protein
LPATRATLETIASLGARCVIPGHGEPFSDVEAALERAFRRTASFEADSLRMARHALKVLLVFTLLDRERMALAGLPDYVDRIPVYRDFNARFFNVSAARRDTSCCLGKRPAATTDRDTPRRVSSAVSRPLDC